MSWRCPREGPSEQPALGLEARSEVAVWETGGWGRRPEASGPCSMAANFLSLSSGTRVRAAGL